MIKNHLIFIQKIFFKSAVCIAVMERPDGDLYECVQRKESEYIGRRIIKMELPGRRQRRGPRRRFMDVLTEDVQIGGVTEEDAEDKEG